MSQSSGRLREIWQDLKPRLSAFGNQTFLSELRELFRIRKNPEGRTKLIVFVAGAVATAISMGGILIGYAVAYSKFMRPYGELPRLTKLPVIVRVSMLLGGMLIWVILFLVVVLLHAIIGTDLLQDRFFLIFLLINTLLSFSTYFIFRRWRNSVHNLLSQSDQYGSARYAMPDEMAEFFMSDGLYIGGNMATDRKGHLLTFAPSRSGKGVSLIIPNILSIRNYSGSIVLIDIKGEAAAVCARRLREQGKNVVIINPWSMLPEQLGKGSCYNPLDILRDKKTSIRLIDDLAMIAELIVPIKSTNDHNAYFTDSARNVVIGLLLHLVTSVEKPTFTMLWVWTRYYGDQWDNLLADMSDSKDKINGHAIRNAANEIAKMAESPETFASIMSNVLEATAFLRSGSLQQSLESGFDPYTLADGNTVVFVILPPDLLVTMGRFLRLVTTTMLRAVVRKPNKKVTFILDEAASLGFISEVPVAMAAYAGMNVSMWLIYQDLQQLQDTYGNRWESIIANSAVKHFVVDDNTTAAYVNKLMGKKTRTVYTRDLFGFVKDVETSERDLETPDEIMRETKHRMLLFTSGNYPVSIQKFPYFFMEELKDAPGNNLYDPNPYELNSL